jgi:hypothetical protein
MAPARARDRGLLGAGSAYERRGLAPRQRDEVERGAERRSAMFIAAARQGEARQLDQRRAESVHLAREGERRQHVFEHGEHWLDLDGPAARRELKQLDAQLVHADAVARGVFSDDDQLRPLRVLAVYVVERERALRGVR